jgi:GT2 family glycosyltransferase
MPSENVENSINGSCWMMKKEVLAKVGPWDETFKHYFSDQDFFIKCKMAGFRLTCVGNMWMGHGGSATYKNIKDKISEDINLERDMMLARYGEINYDNWLNKKNNYV